MLKLDITPNRAILLDNEKKGCYDLGLTKCAFGNMVSMLKTEYPYMWNLPLDKQIIEYVTKGVRGEYKHKDIWGFKEGGSIVVFIRLLLEDHFDNQDKVSLDMKMVEDIRIKNGIDSCYFPRSNIDYSEGAEFKAKRINDVIYGLLYYYALNGLKLVNCEHCGRWFATNSFKNKFCSRNSLVEGYTHLKCEEAVRNIKQQIRRNYSNIYSTMTTYQQNYGNQKINKFLDDYAQYSERIKKRQSVKNLSECLNFLKQFKVYNSICTILYNKINAKNISEQECETRKEHLVIFENENQEWQENIKNGYKTNEEYINWLNDYKRGLNNGNNNPTNK